MILSNFRFNDETKFIVIPTLAIGGAEKRFFDIFCSLSTNYNSIYYLVLPKSLFIQISAQISITELILDRIIIIGEESDTLFTFCFKYYRWLNKNSIKGMHFHYPVNCLFPLHFFKGHILSISLTDCFYEPTFFSTSKSKVRQRLTMLFASKIDVLNETIYTNLKDNLWFSKKKLSITPGGTFVAPESCSYSVKSPKVAIVSRLIDGKGILEFLDILPAIWQSIVDKVPEDFLFSVCGDGPLAEIVDKKIRKYRFEGIPINYEGFVIPSKFLTDVSIVLSLQVVTNYPSRVVAESIMSGCHVFIRDSGDSKMFGNDSIAFSYISNTLNPLEISHKIVEILEKTKNDNFIQKIRLKGIDKFASKSTTDYFDKLISSNNL